MSSSATDSQRRRHRRRDGTPAHVSGLTSHQISGCQRWRSRSLAAGSTCEAARHPYGPKPGAWASVRPFSDHLVTVPQGSARAADCHVRPARLLKPIGMSGCGRSLSDVCGEYARKFSGQQAFRLVTALSPGGCKSIAKASKVRILHLPPSAQRAPDQQKRRSGALSWFPAVIPTVGGHGRRIPTRAGHDAELRAVVWESQYR